MAATAARASLVTPQAITGTWMRSPSSLLTRSRMSSDTSTIIRSAPRPERSTASAWSVESAWVTEAPLSIAILLAVVSWPPSVPTIRSRMLPLRLDDFRHGHAKLVLDENDLAARDQTVVDVDVDGFADLAVELEHGAGAEAQQFADLHAGAAEHRGHLHRHVEHGFQVFRAAADRLAHARREHAGVIRGLQFGAALQIGEGHFCVVGQIGRASCRGR